MCSNTSDGGGGCGGGDGRGEDGCCWSSCLEKPKRPRVPKRGPGVAELEKILREQEKKDEVSSSCLVSALSDPYNPQSCIPYQPPPPQPQPPPPRTTVAPPPMMMRNPASLAPPMKTLYGNGVKSSVQGGSGSAFCRSVMDFPEKTIFPTMWSPCGLSIGGEGPKWDPGISFSQHLLNESNPILPSPAMLHEKHCQYPFSMMNHLPGTVFSSTLIPPSAGLTHHIEPPSSQRSHSSYTSIWPEQEKIVGMKRPWPFSMDNTPDPFLKHKNPPIFPIMHRADQSSSGDNHSAYNLETRKTVFRHTKWGSQSELNSKTSYGAPDWNFLRLTSPTIPSPKSQNFQGESSKLNLFPFQESMQELHQMSGPGGSGNKRPFYSFLQTKEQINKTETVFGLDKEFAEAGGDGIDLNLKL